MVDYEPGEKFEVTIDRISKAGNGIIEDDQGEHHLNVGRIDGMQGDVIKVQYIGDGIAYCLEPEKRGENYNVTKESGLTRGNGYRTPMNGDQKRNNNDILNKF